MWKKKNGKANIMWVGYMFEFLEYLSPSLISICTTFHSFLLFLFLIKELYQMRDL